jgi:large subunit ribosomal protein L25
MGLIDLRVDSRESGKRAVNAVRNDGKVPGVFYLKGEESVSIAAKPNDLKGIVYTAETKIINLIVDDKDPIECVLRDTDFDPVTDELIHFDLLGIVRGQLINVEVPIVIIGSKPLGVSLGGLLQQVLHRVPIRCLPKNIPNSIEVDCSQLNIGESILIRDIDIENIEFSVPESTAIASIVQSRVSKSEMGEGEEGMEGESESEETSEE